MNGFYSFVLNTNLKIYILSPLLFFILIFSKINHVNEIIYIWSLISQLMIISDVIFIISLCYSCYISLSNLSSDKLKFIYRNFTLFMLIIKILFLIWGIIESIIEPINDFKEIRFSIRVGYNKYYECIDSFCYPHYKNYKTYHINMYHMFFPIIITNFIDILLLIRMKLTNFYTKSDIDKLKLIPNTLNITNDVNIIKRNNQFTLTNITCELCNKNNEQNYILINLCNCNGFRRGFHVGCYLNLISQHDSNRFKYKCDFCDSYFKHNFNLNISDNIIYFPYNDVYPSVINKDKYVKLYNKFDTLKYSIIYLQFDRFKHLLNDFNHEEFKDFCSTVFIDNDTYFHPIRDYCISMYNTIGYIDYKSVFRLVLNSKNYHTSLNIYDPLTCYKIEVIINTKYNDFDINIDDIDINIMLEELITRYDAVLMNNKIITYENIRWVYTFEEPYILNIIGLHIERLVIYTCHILLFISILILSLHMHIVLK